MPKLVPVEPHVQYQEDPFRLSSREPALAETLSFVWLEQYLLLTSDLCVSALTQSNYTSEHAELFDGFPLVFRHIISPTVHIITFCPCTGMLQVFTVSSFLFFSVFLWLAETGKYENIVDAPKRSVLLTPQRLLKHG